MKKQKKYSDEAENQQYIKRTKQAEKRKSQNLKKTDSISQSVNMISQ